MHEGAAKFGGARKSLGILMSFLFHAVLWLDSHHAQILQFVPTQGRTRQLKALLSYKRRSAGHMRSEHEFFAEICDALDGQSEVLVAGSHAAQTGFHRYVDRLRPDVANRIVDWQTLEQPIADEVIALARRHFSAPPATTQSNGQKRTLAGLEFA